MESVDYAQVIRRRWRVVVVVAVLTTLVVVLLGPSISGGFGDSQPTSYTATSTLLVRGDVGYTLQQLALLAQQGEVPRRASAAIGDSDAAASLEDDVSTTVDVDGEVLTITVEVDDPARAQLLSEALARELIAFVGDRGQQATGGSSTARAARLQELAEQLRDIDERIAADPDNSVLEAERQGLLAAYAQLFQVDITPESSFTTGTITLLGAPSSSPASGGLLDSGGSLPRRLALGATLGVLLGVAVALVIDRFDTRLRDRATVEHSTGLPVLAELPLIARRRGHTWIAGLLVGRQETTPEAESFRSLRGALLLLLDDRTQDRRTATVSGREGSIGIVVCSAGAWEGATSTALNLAAAFAESGCSVVLVAAGNGSANVAAIVGATHHPPMDFTLNGNLEQALADTNVPGLRLLDLHEVAISADQMAPLVAHLDTLADVVVFDVPPLLTTAEAMDLLPFAKAAVLVLRAGRTRAPAAVRAVELLDLGRVPVVTAVLVGTVRGTRGNGHTPIPQGQRQRSPVDAYDRAE